MPTTFTLSGVRRVAVGASASAQGRDGVPELTRTAFDALRNAEWSISDEPPFVPVHDYAQPLPRGDAWKACYGHDADARTERAACGAVVYTFAVPADALTGTACNIAAVTGRVTGDRYLDAGVDCHVVLSASATPPSVADFLARTPDATLCATSSQTQPPNQRAGVTAELAVEPAAAAAAYVHVALLLHDYIGTRGAWIEGGALLEQGRVTVEFSRAVEPDAAPTLSLEVGRPATGQSTGFRWGVVPAPHADVFYCCHLFAPTLTTVGSYADAKTETMAMLHVADASFSVSPAQGDLSWNVMAPSYSLYSNEVSLCRTGINSDHPDYEYLYPAMRAVIRSGVGVGTFRAMSISSPISVGNPLDIAVYALTAPGDCMTPHDSVLRTAFWRGKLTSLNVATKPFNAGDQDVIWARAYPTTAPQVGPSTQVDVAPLAHIAVPTGATLSQIVFDAPLVVDGIVTILLAVSPSATVPPAYRTDSTTIPTSTVLSLVP